MVILSPSLGYSGTFGKGEMLWCLRKAESPLLHASLSRWKREIFGIWLTTMRIIRLRLWKQAVFTQLLGKVSPCFIKCNVGMAWDSSGPLRGASWVTRDSQCRPLDHSRRAFCSPLSKQESNLKAMLWAVEDMGNLIIWSNEKFCLKFLLRRWDSHFWIHTAILNSYHFLQKSLSCCTDTPFWWMVWFHVLDHKNNVATAIADSVVSYFCTQSYVTRWWTLLASSSYPTGGRCLIFYSIGWLRGYVPVAPLIAILFLLA